MTTFVTWATGYTLPTTDLPPLEPTTDQRETPPALTLAPQPEDELVTAAVVTALLDQCVAEWQAAEAPQLEIAA